jgi:DnaK suppressor protein
MMDEINFDFALQQTEIEREDAIRRILNRQLEEEEPVFNDAGDRICFDCEVLIPPKRVELVPHAVRCVECQSIAERPW